MPKICKKHNVKCIRTADSSKKSGLSSYRCPICRLEQRREHSLKMKQKAVNYLGGKCQVCGFDENTACLDFHHLDPTQKEFDISKKCRSTWKNLKPELDKCILVCKNCHTMIHYTHLSKEKDKIDLTLDLTDDLNIEWDELINIFKRKYIMFKKPEEIKEAFKTIFDIDVEINK